MLFLLAIGVETRVRDSCGRAQTQPFRVSAAALQVDVVVMVTAAVAAVTSQAQVPEPKL